MDLILTYFRVTLQAYVRATFELLGFLGAVACSAHHNSDDSVPLTARLEDLPEDEEDQQRSEGLEGATHQCDEDCPVVQECEGESDLEHQACAAEHKGGQR